MAVAIRSWKLAVVPTGHSLGASIKRRPCLCLVRRDRGFSLKREELNTSCRTSKNRDTTLHITSVMHLRKLAVLAASSLAWAETGEKQARQAGSGSAAWEAAYSQASTALSRLSQQDKVCLLYTSPSPRDQRGSRMPSSA